jgi:hypothetical protein
MNVIAEEVGIGYIYWYDIDTVLTYQDNTNINFKFSTINHWTLLGYTQIYEKQKTFTKESLTLVITQVKNYNIAHS